MILGNFLKQPVEIRRVTLDYSQFLTPGDTLTEVITESDGLTITLASTLPDTLATFFVAGGETGAEYTVTVTADTSAGERIQSEIIVAVEEISA